MVRPRQTDCSKLAAHEWETTVKILESGSTLGSNNLLGMEEEIPATMPLGLVSSNGMEVAARWPKSHCYYSQVTTSKR